MSIATAPQASAPAVPALRQGPVAAAGGAVIVPGLPDRATVRRLAVEAFGLAGEASRQTSVNVIGDDGRGATPSRELANGQGGPEQDALYHHPPLHDWLLHHVGVRVRPTSARGTYSYYTRPGDYLDLHVDIVGCDVTLITVLHDDTPAGDPGGGLALYGAHTDLPLSAIRAERPPPTAVLVAAAGQSIVLLGGLVPHRVLPLTGGSRVISALCFEAVG